MNNKHSKKFLIVGANFINKGAQSMLFVTIDEIAKRVPSCTIYFASNEVLDDTFYMFKGLFYTNETKLIALKRHTLDATIVVCKRWVKDAIKFVSEGKADLFRYTDTKRIISQIDCIIDVSGFAIGSKWQENGQQAYLDNIRLAQRYNIPIVLMPQSFGDFNYSQDKAYLLSQIGELLKYPKVVFVREKEGYQMLLDQFHLDNVRLSTDLVLQNKGIDPANIYRNPPELMLPDVEKNVVAIVPNKQCFNHGDKESNLKLYKDIIMHLIEKGKKVYLFRHSKEDLEICRMIVERFGSGDKHAEVYGTTTTYNNGSIVLLDNDFSCFEYDEFIKKFDFVICSRFHGCVHAYRNFVPCILLGWAVKYQELAENVGEEQYAFDITAKGFGSDKVIAAVDNMIAHRDKESGIIKQHVDEIQKQNCFDQIEEWLY